MCHKTTRAMVTLEFNDQERKTHNRHNIQYVKLPASEIHHKRGEVIAHTSQRYKSRKQLGVIMNKESYKPSHYERCTWCQSIWPTRDLPQSMQNPTENRSRQTRKKNRPWVGPPFSSWITDQAMTEFTQNITEVDELLINLNVPQNHKGHGDLGI